MATGWMVRVQFPVGTIDISLIQSIQTSPETHPASYPMCNRITFSGGKVARKGSRPLTSIYYWGEESHTSPGCNAELSYVTTLTLISWGYYSDYGIPWVRQVIWLRSDSVSRVAFMGKYIYHAQYNTPQWFTLIMVLYLL